MAKSEHQKYHFKASEFGDGTPYITTEPMGENLTILKNSTLYFSLPEGTTLAGAKEVALFLNTALVLISTTTFEEEEICLPES